MRKISISPGRWFPVLLTGAILLLYACDAPLNSYEAKSAGEEGIKKVLLDFESGVNERNVEKVAGLLHPGASIMIGKERTVLSKDAYVRVLHRRLAESPVLGLGTPRIALEKERADVRVYMTRGDARILMVFHMVFDKGRWWINGWEY